MFVLSLAQWYSPASACSLIFSLCLHVVSILRSVKIRNIYQNILISMLHIFTVHRVRLDDILSISNMYLIRYHTQAVFYYVLLMLRSSSQSTTWDQVSYSEGENKNTKLIIQTSNEIGFQRIQKKYNNFSNIRRNRNIQKIEPS